MSLIDYVNPLSGCPLSEIASMSVTEDRKCFEENFRKLIKEKGGLSMSDLAVKLYEDFSKEYPRIEVSMDWCVDYILKCGNADVKEFYESLHPIQRCAVGDRILFRYVDGPSNIISGKIDTIYQTYALIDDTENFRHSPSYNKIEFVTLLTEKEGYNVVVSKEKILKAAEENPCIAKVLEELFPEVFLSDPVFCKVGTTFLLNNELHAIFKWNSEVRILYIPDGIMWGTKEPLKVSSLKAPDKKSVTVSEFRKLTGHSDLSKFIFKTDDKD